MALGHVEVHTVDLTALEEAVHELEMVGPGVPPSLGLVGGDINHDW